MTRDGRITDAMSVAGHPPRRAGALAMPAMTELHVLRVFIGPDGRGGNPLGVFLDGAAIPPDRRQAVAAELGLQRDRLRRRRSTPRGPRRARHGHRPHLHPGRGAALRRPSRPSAPRGCSPSRARRSTSCAARPAMSRPGPTTTAGAGSGRGPRGSTTSPSTSSPTVAEVDATRRAADGRPRPLCLGVGGRGCRSAAQPLLRDRLRDRRGRGDGRGRGPDGPSPRARPGHPPGRRLGARRPAGPTSPRARSTSAAGSSPSRPARSSRPRDRDHDPGPPRLGRHRHRARGPRLRGRVLGVDPPGRPRPGPGAVRAGPRQRRLGRPQPDHPAVLPPARLRPPGQARLPDLGGGPGRGRRRPDRDRDRRPRPVARRPGHPAGRLHRQPGRGGRPVRAARCAPRCGGAGRSGGSATTSARCGRPRAGSPTRIGERRPPPPGHGARRRPARPHAGPAHPRGRRRLRGRDRRGHARDGAGRPDRRRLDQPAARLVRPARCR